MEAKWRRVTSGRVTVWGPALILDYEAVGVSVWKDEVDHSNNDNGLVKVSVQES